MTRLKKKLDLPQIKGYTFDKLNHVHALDGKALTGVTTVLSVIAKPMLIQWSANMTAEYIRGHVAYAIPGEDGGYWAIKPSVIEEARVAHRKKKESAGEAGTSVHATCEELIKDAINRTGGIIEMRDFPENSQVQNFINWAVTHNVKFLESEKNLYSREMWVGGIADIVCEIDGRLYVGDIKTGSGIYPEHYIQASAYSAMMPETKFDGVVIINLKKDGAFDVKFNYDLEGNLNAFKSALTLYRHLNALK